jgi:CRISPR system Cascade subunit CasD
MALPKADLNTILSTRDYRQDAAAVVALQARDGAHYSLARIADALRHPRFVLYLGRKSCPLAAPLHPVVIDAGSVREAFEEFLHEVAARLPEQAGDRKVPAPMLRKIAWGDDFGADDETSIGLSRALSVVRKDRMLARDGWQFGDRVEHIALMEEE